MKTRIGGGRLDCFVALRTRPVVPVRMLTSVLAVGLSFALCGCRSRARGEAAASREQEPPRAETAVQLTSPAFEEGQLIPRRHTCDAADVSPPLHWSAGPADTQAFALVVEGPDAPQRQWVHWVYFNLTAHVRELPEGVGRVVGHASPGARQGLNDFGRLGYGGPCPPAGPAHRYVFQVFALNAALELPEGATLEDVAAAMEGHVLTTGRLSGRYARED